VLSDKLYYVNIAGRGIPSEIAKEHFILLNSPGDIMQSILKTIGLAALIGVLFILPFMIMEIVNRRAYDEDFPFMLFFAMWLNVFAISLILLPVVRDWRAGKRDRAEPVPVQGNTLLTNPKSAALISIALILFPLILVLLESLGWVPLNTLVNGPNPEQTYIPGLFINLALFSLPVAGGIIAAGPVARTLRAGGSLFAHPVNLIIVVLLVSTFAYGFTSFLIDQWPCFIGVPVCD
jgi:hypothetical protein